MFVLQGMRFSGCIAAVVCGSLLACSLPPALAQTQTQTLNVDARLVVVPVTVRDNKDHLVRTLNKDDFTLTVDGKAQSIRYFDREDDLPLTLGLLVDVSGSQRSVLDSERTASSSFLDNMLQPDRDKAFVIQFGRQADLLADVTGSVPKLQAALEKIDSDQQSRPQFGNDNRNGSGDSGDSSGSSSQSGNGGYGGRGGYGGGRRGGGSRGSFGGTVLYDAVYLASTDVMPKPAKDAKSGGPARKALVLLTDGEDRGSKESIAEAIEAAQRADFTVYAIYYKGEEDHGGYGGGGFPGRFPGGRGGGFPSGGGRGGGQRTEHVDGKKILERMAGETGGRVYEVSKKMPLQDIYRQIAEELRSQYRLGFSPVNNDDGYHRVVVDTPKEKKAVLQFRDGYYTGAAK